jgi:teichuronic acid biosynthesis glycosyltransferase TuaC
MRVLALTNMYPIETAPSYGRVVYEQVASLRTLGVTVDVLTIEGDDRMNYVRAPASLKRRIDTFKPDLVHAHYGLSGAVALLQRRVPVVTTFHGSDTGYVRWQGYVSWFVARLTTPIFVDAEGAARLCVENAAVIPCGVDLNRFHTMDRGAARRRLGWAEAGHYVLLPGSRTHPVKRADLFDAAVQQARAEVGNLTGVTLEQLPREQVALMMNAADVTLMTSESEGSPVAIKESLACLTPVVSVPVGDVPTLIEGLPGCAVVPRDPRALADAVVRALGADRRPELRERVEPFGQDRVAAQLVALYERVLEARRR